MKITTLITGARGQLGQELQRTAPAEANCHALGRDDLDITQASDVASIFGELKPALVLNAAAYTAVDDAESNEDAAFAVNADGAENLASECKKHGAHLIHVSTDFVFTKAHSAPITEEATPDPASVYARSKEEGERRVLHLLDGDASVVRTSWLYSALGGGNFVRSMLRLMEQRDELGIVADQVGAPTWAKNTAEAIWKLSDRTESAGMWHVTDSGVATWYDFAVAIFEEASAIGLLESGCDIQPIRTEDYGAPAPRPAYSLLSNFKAQRAELLRVMHWREGLRRMLEEVAAAE
jgi:dTDP-4-dehydrorhamnose reductase